MTIDSATALLTQTITALLEAEDDYADVSLVSMSNPKLWVCL